MTTAMRPVFGERIPAGLGLRLVQLRSLHLVDTELLHTVQPLGDLCDAAVLQAVVLRFRPAPGRQRVRDQELEGVAEQRRGLQEVGRAFPHDCEGLDSSVGVIDAPTRHRGECM